MSYPRIISEWVEREFARTVAERENRLQVLIQPKPAWLPEWAWNRVLRRVLALNVELDINQ